MFKINFQKFSLFFVIILFSHIESILGDSTDSSVGQQMQQGVGGFIQGLHQFSRGIQRYEKSVTNRFMKAGRRIDSFEERALALLKRWNQRVDERVNRLKMRNEKTTESPKKSIDLNVAPPKQGYSSSY